MAVTHRAARARRSTGNLSNGVFGMGIAGTVIPVVFGAGVTDLANPIVWFFRTDIGPEYGPPLPAVGRVDVALDHDIVGAIRAR